MKKTISLLLSLSLIISISTVKVNANMQEVNLENKINAKSAVQKLDRNSILKAIELAEKQKEEIQKESMNNIYSDNDLYILTHVIVGEAGSDWLTDEEQLLVANVVINRVNSDNFPNTIKEVVFQPGQYACVNDGNYYRKASQRIVENAKKILSGQRYCPGNVLYQSNFIQGDVYKKIGDTYFCY